MDSLKRYLVIWLKEKNINYNLRSQPDFVIPHVKTVYQGSNSVRYFGPIIWSLVPKEIKNYDTLASFDTLLKLDKETLCLSS